VTAGLPPPAIVQPSPYEVSYGLLFPTPTAAAIAFLGATDARELKGEIPPLKALFVRSQIAVCVGATSRSVWICRSARRPSP